METDLEKRLAAAQAELAAIEQAREARHAAAAERARVDEIERELSNAKAIAAAEESIGVGKFATVPTPAGVVIVKGPNQMHYRKFISAKELTPDDAERLVYQCLVHPSRGEFQAIAAEYPGIPMLAAGAVVELAAGKRAELKEKS